jgi:non-ribosomal peptide synthetase component F
VTGIHEIISRQAILRPSATATRDADGRTLTYAQLVGAATRVAEVLLPRLDGAAPAPSHDQQQGISADTPVVAVALQRGGDMVAAMLGVSLAGATWVYLDPSYPGE